ncbi:hypothetical protein SCHPADRAFT_896603 [Schizopora paradoxa]|uniref:Uncharacterized protein n=1 Tax=Schizopora paradoxa TaxID=27342 RepID=A0A0H2R024_9AGAM|nr:hypothetical protein SCHPADRAFT_896603 [Schizopora paradoxa]
MASPASISKCPQKPSKANMLKYDVDNSIARRVKLMQMFDVETAILGKRVEEAADTHAAMTKKYTCYSSVPSDPEEALKFLETCETVVNQPATNTTERVFLHALKVTSVRVRRRELEDDDTRYKRMRNTLCACPATSTSTIT